LVGGYKRTGQKHIAFRTGRETGDSVLCRKVDTHKHTRLRGGPGGGKKGGKRKVKVNMYKKS